MVGVEEEMAASDVEYRCFVGSLAWATSDDSLHAAFSPFGEVLESKLLSPCDSSSLPDPGVRRARSDLFFAVLRADHQ
jgi:hypothetical protein